MATSDSTPKTVEITLTKGFVALIDECDADLAQYKWYATSRKPDVSYVARQYWIGNDKNKSESMHRVIMERILGRPLVKGEVVDHINHNPRDNRRCNLRICSVTQNGQNRRHQRNATSPYKGVRSAYGDKWAAAIKVNRKTIQLGNYASPEEAYAAYCIAAREHFGEHAYLPDEDKVKHILPARIFRPKHYKPRAK